MTRVAVIGAGVIGAYHVRALSTLHDVQITWIADQDVERATTAAAPIGARATADNAEAIGAANVDAIIVATPTPFHRTAVDLAAAHGKHVFCEKPIARTVEDGEAIVGVCRAAGIRLMIGHVVRFFPEYARAKTVLDSGTLGQIGVVRTGRIGSSPGPARPWFSDLAMSGGLVVDLMIHELDTLRWFFGDVERVFAKGLSYTPYQPTRDAALATLRFANGVIAHVEASWAHAGFKTFFEIAGDQGLLRYDSEAGATLRLDRPDWATDSSGAPLQPPLVLRGSSPDRPYQTELRRFFDRLEDGQPFLTTGEDGVRALETALAVLASMRTGKAVHFVDGRAPRDVLQEGGR